MILESDGTKRRIHGAYSHGAGLKHGLKARVGVSFLIGRPWDMKGAMQGDRQKFVLQTGALGTNVFEPSGRSFLGNDPSTDLHLARRTWYTL